MARRLHGVACARRFPPKRKENAVLRDEDGKNGKWACGQYEDVWKRGKGHAIRVFKRQRACARNIAEWSHAIRLPTFLGSIIAVEVANQNRRSAGNTPSETCVFMIRPLAFETRCTETPALRDERW